MIYEKIALAGNPNVGKSTVFNALTGMKQHTGNWSGKTVGTAEGVLRKGKKEIKLIDLPGTYSLAADSAEEEVTRDFLCFEKFDGAVVVCDACCLERNLIFALQVAQLVPKTLLCINMLDDARKKGIEIDIKSISEETGLPAIGISASNGEGLDKLSDMIFSLAEGKLRTDFLPVRYPEKILRDTEKLSPVLNAEFGLSGIYPALAIIGKDRGFISALEKRFGSVFKKIPSDPSSGLYEQISSCIVLRAEEICLSAVRFSKNDFSKRDKKIDSVLTGKTFGIPIMLILFGFIFWLTVSGANYPSEILSVVFSKIGMSLDKFLSSVGFSTIIKSLLIDGIWNVLSWVVAVMLPPMAIFFPLFTILEDIGYLPRVAFNLDRGFCRAGTCGKQALTMWSVYNLSFSHILFRRCFYE